MVMQGSGHGSTVTVAEQDELLPHESVTVRNTTLGPTFAHVNESWLMLKMTGPQLSADPLSISSGTIRTYPVAISTSTVISTVAHTGGVVSSTSIIWMQVLELPQASVATHVRLIVYSCGHV